MNGCDVLEQRVPKPAYQDAEVGEAHAYLALCGRPVVEDGLCVRHLRHLRHLRERPPRWRRALARIGR